MGLTCVDAATDGDLGTYSAQPAERAGEWRSSAVTTGMMLLGCGQVRVTGQELSRPAGLRVRRRDGTLEGGLLEVVGDMISTATANCFDLVPPGAYVPRVTVDDLVVNRETWRLAATEPGFAGTADESIRYPAARA
jgi:hypothetical protein